MRRTTRIPASVLFLLLLTPALALADTVTLQPVKDNTLYEPIQQDGYADVSDGVGPTMFTGKVDSALNQSGQVAVRRAVLEFNLVGAIPAGATITAVELTLYCDKVKSNTARNTTLHRVLAEWGEGTSNTGNSQQGRGEPATTNDATWRHAFYSTQFWTAPGGDYVATASATAAVGAVGSYTWASTAGLVADVQHWLDVPADNHGWLVKGVETTAATAKRFATRENTGSGGTLKPRLVVTYTPTVVVGACCQAGSCSLQTASACAAAGGTYQGNGTSCSPNPCAPITGACCASAGTCTEGTPAACASSGGTYQGDGSTCATVSCSVQLTPFVDALPIPVPAVPTSGQPGAAASYTLAIRETQQRLHRDLPLTTVWGYDDGVHGPLYPGPTIEAGTGAPITLTWLNDLRVGGNGPLRTSHVLAVDANCIPMAENNAKAVVHLHGGHVPQESDGYPHDALVPGQQTVYQYPNNQQAATLWYHDHAMGVTRLNVIMGLAGFWLMRDGVESALTLPTGEYEIPIAIQDRTFQPTGALDYPAVWQDHWMGDKIVVNGKVWPYLDVKRGKYRFRLLNGSTSRFYNLRLVPPAGSLPFMVIGTEGGLLEAPVPGLSSLLIAPGERVDVVVDFAGYAPGTEILMTNDAPSPYPGSPGVGVVPNVMKFRVLSATGHTLAIPSTLRTIEQLDPASAVRTRDLTLKIGPQDACGNSPWLINGKTFDEIDEYPELGTTEIWRFINDSGVSHPMHLHLVMFQILDRDGFTKGPGGVIVPNGNPQPPLPQENGWKDTALVGPGEILRVIARFEGFKGKYPYHCHILEHEENEMMRQFQTVQCADGILDPGEACDDGAKLPLDGCGASCKAEEFVQLRGTASGGSVSLTVAGILVSVPTSAGQTPAQVAQALAAAVNANATLQALGVTATALGGRVVLSGDVTGFGTSDAGLAEELALRLERSRLWWATVGYDSTYEVVRGSLPALRASAGDYASPSTTETCLAEERPQTFLVHGETPAPGQGVWYLVRRESGGNFDEGGVGQVGSRDAEIAASGNGCP
jgi:spore coat protein A